MFLFVGSQMRDLRSQRPLRITDARQRKNSANRSYVICEGLLHSAEIPDPEEKKEDDD
jgi:hypothetical protein